jgi:histidinol-phosphatase (PHP family)
MNHESFSPDSASSSSTTTPHVPVLYESHAHTTLCKHAVGTPEEYAAMAEKRGLKGIIFTCHSPLPDGFAAEVRMAPEQVEEYLAMIERARVAYAGRVDVRVGLESDYYPGVEPWLRELHARLPLNHVLGSIHPQMRAYKDIYFNGDFFAYQELYYEHLAEAAETGLFDTMAHPDLIKNEAPHLWSFERAKPHIERALNRIAKTGVAMELNTSGLLKQVPEMNPSRGQLAMMCERGIPVVIGADAHAPHRVADGYEKALMLLREVGYDAVNFFLERRRHTVSIATALASLR